MLLVVEVDVLVQSLELLPPVLGRAAAQYAVVDFYLGLGEQGVEVAGAEHLAKVAHAEIGFEGAVGFGQAGLHLGDGGHLGEHGHVVDEAGEVFVNETVGYGGGLLLGDIEVGTVLVEAREVGGEALELGNHGEGLRRVEPVGQAAGGPADEGGEVGFDQLFLVYPLEGLVLAEGLRNGLAQVFLYFGELFLGRVALFLALVTGEVFLERIEFALRRQGEAEGVHHAVDERLVVFVDEFLDHLVALGPVLVFVEHSALLDMLPGGSHGPCLETEGFGKRVEAGKVVEIHGAKRVSD